jgi:hypothetical protein
MMVPAPGVARQVKILELPIGQARPVRLVVQLHFGPAGALVGVSPVMAPPDRITAEERVALRLAQSIGERLVRRRDIGVAALRRETELLLALLEQLEAAEAAHGDAARTLLASVRA